jgi:hypothetical protein
MRLQALTTGLLHTPNNTQENRTASVHHTTLDSKLLGRHDCKPKHCMRKINSIQNMSSVPKHALIRPDYDGMPLATAAVILPFYMCESVIPVASSRPADFLSKQAVLYQHHMRAFCKPSGSSCSCITP